MLLDIFDMKRALIVIIIIMIFVVVIRSLSMKETCQLAKQAFSKSKDPNKLQISSSVCSLISPLTDSGWSECGGERRTHT
jgi:hypothetical protein